VIDVLTKTSFLWLGERPSDLDRIIYVTQPEKTCFCKNINHLLITSLINSFFKCEKGSYHVLEFYDFIKFYACVYIFLHLLVISFRQFDKSRKTTKVDSIPFHS